MTTQELINYYANLLILQYRGKSKASATVKATVSPVIMDQLPAMVMNAYNIDSAEGVQLDVLGKYIGVTRSGYGFTDFITLNDADYRILLKMKILTNNAGSSLFDIQNLLHQYFEDQIFVFDYQNMRLSYMIDSDIGDQELVQLFVTKGLFPKPMGVQLSAPIYLPDINSFFGFRTYGAPGVNNNPFNEYADYQTDWPWLSYADAFVP